MRKHTSVRLTTRSHQSLKALCALSLPAEQAGETHRPLSPEKVSILISDAPDPATAIRAVLEQVPAHSEILARKWRQLVVDLWSQPHPHIPVLLDLPITAADVSDTAAIQDTFSALRIIANRPLRLVNESGEWLLTADDAYYLAASLPSLQSRPLVQLENEWQCLRLRRLRSLLHALRLVRRQGDQLTIVKSRYQRFAELPTIQQYYLLWHAEVYHVDWSQFAGIWGDHISLVQEGLPLLWDLSDRALPDMPYDLRLWNQELWDTFQPLWEQEGLLHRQPGDSILLAFVRTHALPTAITQVIMRDLFEYFGLVAGEGELYVWTTLGIELTAAERTQELPCALDLLK